ncbi:MAG: hypothetical protein WCA84_12815 [Ignavibacteriaceae bacterium]|jgi:hypothetical protein
MKTLNVLLTMVLIIILTVFMHGQTNENLKSKTVNNGNDISSVLGKPTYESTIDTLNTRVWVLTQARHKKLMKGEMGRIMNSQMKSIHEGGMTGVVNDSSVGMDIATNKEMMEGTYFILLDVVNTISGKEIASGNAKVQIVYPSKNNLAVDLKIMMNYFASALALNERGKYLFTINFDFGGGYKTTQFQYAVR